MGALPAGTGATGAAVAATPMWVVPDVVDDPRRVAVLSVHTSPLDQPGTGDAGGMNVYVTELARRLADRGVEVECSPGPRRATCRRRSSWLPASPCATSRPGRSRAWPRRTCPASSAPSPPACCGPRPCGPRAGTTSCTRTTGCPGRSGGWPATGGACRSSTRCTRWPGSRTSPSPRATSPEPDGRVIGEQQVVDAADRLVANTHDRGPPARRPLRRRPVPGRGRAPRRGPRGVHARRHAPGARPARLSPPTRSCCCSSGGSSR